MAAIGFGLLYLAYSFGLYGYCLTRDYNVTVKQLFSSTWPPHTVAGSQVGGSAGSGVSGGSIAGGVAGSGTSSNQMQQQTLPK